MKRVLFVCMGNICRSPAAEIIFHQMIEQAGMLDVVEIDSAGTIGHHAGNAPDSRMMEALKRRGYRVFGKSRKVTEIDLASFDLILAMDEENLADLRRMNSKAEYSLKIEPFVKYLRSMSARCVPDPYYGGSEGFEHVIDLLEDGCVSLVDHMKRSDGF